MLLFYFFYIYFFIYLDNYLILVIKDTNHLILSKYPCVVNTIFNACWAQNIWLNSTICCCSNKIENRRECKEEE